MIVVDSAIFFSFSPTFLSKLLHAMNAREYYGYPDFLGDLDVLLVEDSPTLEELEVQAFGKVYIQFVMHTEVLMRIH